MVVPYYTVLNIAIWPCRRPASSGVRVSSGDLMEYGLVLSWRHRHLHIFWDPLLEFHDEFWLRMFVTVVVLKIGCVLSEWWSSGSWAMISWSGLTSATLGDRRKLMGQSGDTGLFEGVEQTDGGFVYHSFIIDGAVSHTLCRRFREEKGKRIAKRLHSLFKGLRRNKCFFNMGRTSPRSSIFCSGNLPVISNDLTYFCT